MNHCSALYLAFIVNNLETAKKCEKCTKHVLFPEKNFPSSFIRSSPSLDCPPHVWWPPSPCCSDLSKSLPVQINTFIVFASHNLLVIGHNIHPVKVAICWQNIYQRVDSYLKFAACSATVSTFQNKPIQIGWILGLEQMFKDEGFDYKKSKYCNRVTTCPEGHMQGRLQPQRGQQSHLEWHLPKKSLV